MTTDKIKTYLLLGPEIGKKQDFIDKLKKEQPDAEYYKFYPFDNQMDSLFETLGNESLFSPSRFIVLDEIDQISKQGDIAQLVSYIKSPDKNATLILCSKEVFLKKQNTIQRCFTKDKDLLFFFEMYESDKNKWLKDFFKKENFSISDRACEIIKEQIENNIQEFRNVCTQMAVFYHSEEKEHPQITEEDVEDFLTHTRAENEDTLFKYLIKKDLEASIDCLHSIIRQTDVNRISIFKIWLNFRNLLSFKISETNGTNGKVFSTDKGYLKAKDKFIFNSFGKNYSQKNTEDIMELISDFDFKLKGIPANVQPVLWEQFIYTVIIHNGITTDRPVFASFHNESQTEMI